MPFPCRREMPLQHDNTHSTHLRRVNIIHRIDTTIHALRPPVEEVIVQLSITWLEFLLL
jgi:hypothetical protein